MSAHRREETLRRARLSFAKSPLPGLSRLESGLVKQGTRTQYAAKLTEFMNWAAAEGRDWSQDPHLDSCITDYFDLLFLSGAPPDDGGKLIAALQYVFPRLSRQVLLRLPRASRALRAWRRHGPGLQRLPLPMICLAAAIAKFIESGHLVMGLRLLLQHHTYLRPGEICNLRASQLVPAIPAGGIAYNRWSINVAASEYFLPSKTGMMDESVLIDYGDWLHPYLRELVKNRRPEAPLWPFTQRQLCQCFAVVCSSLKFQALGPTLYSNRHGGASEDILRGRRTLAEAQRRGRWRTDTSVRRYCKEAKLMSELGKLDPKIIAFGRASELALPQLFANPRLAQSPGPPVIAALARCLGRGSRKRPRSGD